MSLWQFAACVDGYNRAHGGDGKPEPMTPDEFDAMCERNAEWLASPAKMQ